MTLEQLKKFGLRLLARIPTQIPIGMTEFNAWMDSIIYIYDFPDNDSLRFALATMVMHLGPTAAHRSKHYFALMIKAAAAKQIASGVFQDIKERQKAAQEAAKQQTETQNENVQ